MKTTEEKNRMIAEFMGVEEEQTEQGEFVFAIKFQNHEKLNDFQTEFYYESELKYHTSWDWLMPVVEEVRTTDLKGTIMENIYSTYVVFPLTYSTEIYRVYDRVVEFIEWYNENK